MSVEKENLYIYYEEECVSSHSDYGHDGDYTGSTEESFNYKITGVSLKPKASAYYETYENEFNLKKGDVGYLIVVRYSTGGTFSSSSGKGHIEKMCQTAEKANQIKNLILADDKHYRNNRHGAGIELKAPIYCNENSYKGYKCWQGYFERLEDVEIIKFTVKEEFESKTYYEV